MPASTSRIGFKILRVRWAAYSLRYMAMHSPTGKATAIAIRLAIRVAVTKGQMPKRPMAGCHSVPPKNFSRFTSSLAKNNSDSRPRTMTMPTVVRIDIAPHRNRNPWMNDSATRGLRLRSCCGPPPNASASSRLSAPAIGLRIDSAEMAACAPGADRVMISPGSQEVGVGSRQQPACGPS